MSIHASKCDKTVRFLICIALVLNIMFWFSVRDVQARWLNVPPAPDVKFASAFALGDPELAYRMNGLMIQNMGDSGGRVISLKDYNYQELTKWFFIEDYLDPHSNFIPYLAGFYFGGVQEPEKFRPVLDYLLEVGQRTEAQKWRWLAQAVFLARFEMEDLNKALELAHVLAEIDNPEMPEWSRQMPAFIMNAKGEKETAYALMLEILKSRGDKLHPSEVNSMRYYICNKILEPFEAEKNPLCENLP